jgi:chromosomal replication initiation ATPase DnaA
MNYVPAPRINAVRHIARSAQQLIKDKTGINVTLVVCRQETSHRTPEEMLQVIASSLEMSETCFRMKTRVRNIAELRFIAAMLLRSNFPKITLHQIAAFFGGQDHTSVISGLSRARNLIHTGDCRFTKKYNVALRNVNQWLRKEVSE